MEEADRIRALVTAAGFGEAGIEPIAFEFHYADADDFWESIVRLAGSARPGDQRLGRA